MTSYLMCLEKAVENDDIPVVVRESADHLLKVAKPSVEIVCKETG